MPRERVTITIKEDLLAQVDRLVDGLTIRSRSQAMEYLLSKLLADFRLGTALVLAGGKSRSYTGKKPRFLLELKGKPVIEHVIDRINEFASPKFHLFVDAPNRAIVDRFNERNKGYNLEFLTGSKPKGNIEPLLLAKPFIRDTFLVAYGDSICSLNINDMLSFHRQNKALATIALTTVSNPRDYGTAMLQGNKITEFIQKPRHNVKSYMVNAGYFLFEPGIFRHIDKGMASLENDLFPKLAEKGLLLGYPFQGRYLNINSVKDAELAEKLL